MKRRNANKGITLIALIITIVVLIILAGVTINLVVGDNGIITKSKEAKQRTQIASEKEKIELEIIDIYVKKVEQGLGKVTVDNVIDKLIEKGMTTEENSTRPNPGEITGNVTLESGNNYQLTEEKNTVRVDWNGTKENIVPILEVIPDTKGNTKKVILTIKARENINGIKELYKDSEKIKSYEQGIKEISETIEITQNGEYKIKVVSNIGKETSKTINIKNIDTNFPEASYKLIPEQGKYAKEVTIEITAKDENGIKSIETPDGIVEKENLIKVDETTYKTNYTATVNDTYTFIVTDEAGNRLEGYNVTVENVDREGPEITGITNNKTIDSITVNVEEVRDAGIGIEGIEYRYFISNIGEWSQYTTKNNYTFTELMGGTEYNIKIQAKDSLGNEGVEFETKIKTEEPIVLPDPITNLAVQNAVRKYTLSWKNPVGENFAGVYVVMNETHIPESKEDGTLIYEGTQESYESGIVEGGKSYYIRLFTYNSEGMIQEGGEGTSIVATPTTYPEKPDSESEYKLTQTYEGNTNTTWTAPKTGWYRIVVAGKGADGSSGELGRRLNLGSNGYAYEDCMSGAGGGGGGCAVSILQYNKGQTVSISINSTQSTFGNIKATSGSGYKGGTASGGNISNKSGNNGSYGSSGPNGMIYTEPWGDWVSSIAGGSGGTGAAPAYRNGGHGGGVYFYAISNYGTDEGLTSGANGIIQIYEAPTNIDY